MNTLLGIIKNLYCPDFVKQIETTQKNEVAIFLFQLKLGASPKHLLKMTILGQECCVGEDSGWPGPGQCLT